MSLSGIEQFVRKGEEETKIEAVCPDGRLLEVAATRLLEQGLRGIGADSESVVLSMYEKKSYGAEIELSLIEVEDCKVTMHAILLPEGKIGNPVLTVDAPTYIEEIHDNGTHDLIKIVGKKVFFSLTPEAHMRRTTALGSSTAYQPYRQVVSSSWGEPTVPAVSAEGFLMHREASVEQEALVYEYLEDPTNMQTLALAVRCTAEDSLVRDKKREQVIACVARDKEYQKRMDNLHKSSGARPLPPN